MDPLYQTIEKLRTTQSVDLTDFKSLSVAQLELLAEEIQYWCLYGNQKPEKLGKCLHQHSQR